MTYTYLDCLALMGVGGAHPGGLQLTKRMLVKEEIDDTLSILDAGCGTGQTSAYLAETYGCKVISIDSNKTMIDKAKQRFTALRLPIKAIVANTEALPFGDGEFDIVLSESVIVFTDLSFTLPEFKRVLKPTGRLLAIEMVVENSISKAEKEEIMQFYQIPRLLSEEEWQKEFQRAGFTKIQIEKPKENLYELGLKNVPDFAFSEEMDHQLYNILAKHEWLSRKYLNKLGFRIIRCR